MTNRKGNCYLGITALSALLTLTAITTGGHATDATLLPNAIQYFMDANGKPLSNGKVFMYTPSTTTAKTTWTSADKAVSQANPIQLGISGKPSSPIYGDGSYRQLVKDQFNNTIWDFTTASTGGGGSTPTPPVSVGDGNTVGTILSWPGLLAPSNYLFAYGQAVLRSDYPTLFSTVTLTTNIICTSGLNVLSGISDTQNIRTGAPVEASCVAPGTTVTAVATNSVTVSSNATVSTAVGATFFPWGNGNGSTTFNIPELRGRMLPGRNNMGGTASASSGLTAGGYGVSPNALGAIGPQSDRRGLVTANLPAYTPVGTITNGAITSTFTGVAGQTGLGNSGGSSAYASGGFASSQIIGTVSSTQAASTFTGTPQGGVGEGFSIIPPAVTINYIIKVLPDSVPSAVATSIIVATTGVAGGTTNGLLYNNGGVLGNIPVVNNGLLITNSSGVPSFSSVFPSILFDTLTFRGAISGTVALSADGVAGTQNVHVPESSGSIPAWITPQYKGALCNGTDDGALIQAAVDDLPVNGGFVYFPPGSVCSTSSTIVINKPNVTFLGVTHKNEVATASSTLVYTGTGARFIDARDNRGFTIAGMNVVYTSSSFTGKFIDFGGLIPGSTVSALGTIFNSRLGASTDRTGTATLVYAGETVDLNIDGVYFWHGAPVFKGQSILGQNVRTTITNSFFVKSDTIPINGCGEAMVVSKNSFENLAGGAAGAFINSSGLYCKALVWDSNWHGDISVAGGTWFDGYLQGGKFSGNQMAGDLSVGTQGIVLRSSNGVMIGGGNRFELLSVAINCATATTTGAITGNVFTSVTSQLSNGANCPDMSAEGNTPSMSRYASSQIPIGQSSADLAPKTVSGALTNTAAGVFTVNLGAGVQVIGALPNANLANSATTVNGQTCTLGAACTITAAATSIAVGTTTISSGTTARVLYDNAGVLGEYTTAQLTAQINAATASLSGAVPAWPNNTTSFFRGDGTYAAVAASGLSGLGTSVATALGINVGSAGAFVTNGGALGTPSSGTLTNTTGLPTAGLIDAAVTYAKIQQAPAFTLVGVAGSSTANLASITASAQDQVMRVDTLGATIGWGSVNLAVANAVGTSVLRAVNGGTGLSALGTGVATALGVNVGSAGAFVTLNGAGGTPSSLTLTNATGLPFATGGTGQVPLANGGTNANLTASNGGIFYSTASAGAILAGTATARQMLQSGATAAPAWSTTTWPATTTINRLLYSSAANVISDLATANSAVLVTDSGGIPSLGTAVPNGVTGTTQAIDDSTTKLATDAFVLNQAAAATPLVDSGSGAVGTSTRYARADHVHPAINTNTPVLFAAGNLVAISQASTWYFTYGGVFSTENVAAIPMSVPGTFKNMYVATNSAPAAGQTYTVTMRKNATDQTVTCQVTGTPSVTICNDTTHTFTVVAGDLIAVKLVTSATSGTATGFSVGLTLVTTSP